MSTSVNYKYLPRGLNSHRMYNITVNNPQKYPLIYGNEQINISIGKFHPIYYCHADEISRSGTYHKHIFIMFLHPVYFGNLQRELLHSHIEPCYASAKQNRDYIGGFGKYSEKEGQVDGSFFEWHKPLKDLLWGIHELRKNKMLLQCWLDEDKERREKHERMALAFNEKRGFV